jgi:hypothetical protein
VQKPGPLLDFLEYPLPMMHKGLHAALVKSGVSNLQVHPINLRDPVSGGANFDYLAVNVVGLVAAVDASQSESDPLCDDADLLIFFDRIVIDPAKTQGAEFFRLAEHTGYVVVSDRLRQIILAQPRHFGSAFSPLFETDEPAAAFYSPRQEPWEEESADEGDNSEDDEQD